MPRKIENIQLKFEGPTPVLYALPKAVPGPTDRCRFTKGGAHIITDERGNTCARSEWNPSSGCCPAAGQPPPACAALEAGTDAKLDMGDAGACEANTKCCGRYETCTACCLAIAISNGHCLYMHAVPCLFSMSMLEANHV